MRKLVVALLVLLALFTFLRDVPHSASATSPAQASLSTAQP